jgi:rod shape-determining protein MreC
MRGSRQTRLLLVLLLLTAFTLTTLDVRAGSGSPLDPVRRGADAVLGPPVRALGGVARTVGGALSGLSRLGGYSDDRVRLSEENARLRAQLAASEGQARRLAELDALMGLKDFGTYTLVPGRVAGVGSSFGFAHTVTVDVGSNDGVRPGQTVVSGDGLVGRTTRVGPFTSTVVLLLDPGFTVGSRLQREGTIGFARGAGWARPMTYQQVEGGRVQPGDVLLTTGSETFVPGVPVGRVEEVDPSASAVVRTATVRPFVDVTALDLVGVVVDGPRDTPRVPIPPELAS